MARDSRNRAAMQIFRMFPPQFKDRFSDLNNSGLVWIGAGVRHLLYQLYVPDPEFCRSKLDHYQIEQLFVLNGMDYIPARVRRQSFNATDSRVLIRNSWAGSLS